MEENDVTIGAKVEHPQFGVGIITNVSLTSYTVFFINRGDKEIATTFKGLTLLEPSKADTSGKSGGGSISLTDMEKVFTNVLRRYSDFPELVEMADKWKKGTLVLKPGSGDLKPKEIPIDAFFHKIVLIRDRIRVMEQKINSSDNLDDQEKLSLQQYITRIYGSMTTFNVLFKHKEQYFVGDRGSDD